MEGTAEFSMQFHDVVTTMVGILKTLDVEAATQSPTKRSSCGWTYVCGLSTGRARGTTCAPISVATSRCDERIDTDGEGGTGYCGWSDTDETMDGSCNGLYCMLLSGGVDAVQCEVLGTPQAPRRA